MSSKNKIHVFLYEGSAEKFIINKLWENNKLFIQGTKVEDGFVDKISTANLTYKSFVDMDLNERDKMDSTVIIVGDKLSKINLKFFKNDSEKQEWKELNAKLVFLSIKPDPEILLIHHFDIFDEWNKKKGSQDLQEFINSYCAKHKINRQGNRNIKIKSLKFWETIFADVDDLISAIQKLNKSNEEQNKEKNRVILSYKDIIK